MRHRLIFRDLVAISPSAPRYSALPISSGYITYRSPTHHSIPPTYFPPHLAFGASHSARGLSSRIIPSRPPQSIHLQFAKIHRRWGDLYSSHRSHRFFRPRIFRYSPIVPFFRFLIFPILLLVAVAFSSTRSQISDIAIPTDFYQSCLPAPLDLIRPHRLLARRR